MQHLLTILLLSGDHWVLLLMFNHRMHHSHFGWIRKYDIQTICIMKTLVLMSFQIVCNLQSVRECPTPNYTYHYYITIGATQCCTGVTPWSIGVTPWCTGDTGWSIPFRLQYIYFSVCTKFHPLKITGADTGERLSLPQPEPQTDVSLGRSLLPRRKSNVKK